jgi:hypothetical protein
MLRTNCTAEVSPFPPGGRLYSCFEITNVQLTTVFFLHARRVSSTMTFLRPVPVGEARHCVWGSIAWFNPVLWPPDTLVEHHRHAYLGANIVLYSTPPKGCRATHPTWWIKERRADQWGSGGWGLHTNRSIVQVFMRAVSICLLLRIWWHWYFY